MDAAGKPGGFFITFEGPEGGGKSTQIHRLAAALAEEGYVVWTTREPGGTRLGEMIRPLLLGSQQSRLSPWTEALLFTAARAELVDEVIRPRLQRGEVVLCDRFSDSTLAYQGFGRGLDLKSLRRLQAEATGSLWSRWFTVRMHRRRWMRSTTAGFPSRALPARVVSCSTRT